MSNFHRKSSKNHKEEAFTLVEVLMVILVISVLTGMILGIAGLANSKAAESRAKSELQILANEFEDYRMEKGAYPEQTGAKWDEFRASNAQTNMLQRYGNNTIVDIPDVDPWGRSYEFKIPTSTGYLLELRSLGPDGKGSNSDQDIDNVVL